MRTAHRNSLAVLLGAIVFLSTNVLAAAAVLGVDLGTEYIKAALVKPGIPLEIVLTKDSRRKETSAVAFKPLKGGPKDGQYPERAYGADAMALSARFPGEVYPNLKTLLGLPTEDAIVSEYSSKHPALQLQAQTSRGTATFKTSTLSQEEEAWMVEELLAMQLQSIQKNAEATAGDGSTVRSVVLTVPPFYTIEEKRALQLAAELAGLKVLSLISDGMAVGLNYATSRQFPNVNEGAKPEYHMIFDMGAGSTSATILKFQSRTVKDVGKYNKTVQEVQSLGSGWDRTLGGDSLNYLIMDDLISQFVNSKGAQKISATAEAFRSHGRAMAKISKEAERVRHVLSANQNTQASFEGLYEDVDFKYKITRGDFEKMAAPHGERIGAVVNDAVKVAGLDIADLDSIILHGGASRTPFVREALEKVAGSADKLRSNVNSDEAAVFGAGFRAAELSPSFRVKEIRVSEGSAYASGIRWTNSNGKVQRQRLWTALSALGGIAKEMTFTEKNDFSATFYQQVGSLDRDIMQFTSKNLTTTVKALKDKYPTCAESEIVFKLALKLHSENGEVTVTKAHVECEAEVPKERFVDGVKSLFGFGKKDQQPLTDEEGTEKITSDGSEEVIKENGQSTSSLSADVSTTSSGTVPNASASAEEGKAEEKKKQMVLIPVEVELEKAGVPQLSKSELTKSKDRLKAFAASDKSRIQREEALNQLEGFTYKIRDLLDNEGFLAKSTEGEREALAAKASAASNWLYEEGVDATKDEFKAKLKALQELVSPIQTRVDEALHRPDAITKFQEVMNSTASFLENTRKQISEYEEWKATASSASTSETTSETPTAAAGEFDGLEDEESNASEESEKTDKAEPPKNKGPTPPIYKQEDVDEIQKLYQTTLDWFKDMDTKQAALVATANPVLLVNELAAKREKLEKLVMDIAMKGIRFMESEAKKASKGKLDKKKSKSKKSDDSKKQDKSEKSKLSEEEIDELLQKIMKEEELRQKSEDAGAKFDGSKEEMKHDEL